VLKRSFLFFGPVLVARVFCFIEGGKDGNGYQASFTKGSLKQIERKNMNRREEL